MAVLGGGASGSPCLRVLESFTAIRSTTNPYIAQLWQALEAQDGLCPSKFSWRLALLGRYDVYHVHWPEQMMGGRTCKGRMARRLLTTAFCLRLWVSRIPVVRTWHNLQRPGGLTWYDHRLLDVLDRLTALRIRLNPVGLMPQDAPYETILHGHYRSWFAPYPQQEAVSGRIGYVGLIRRYKGVEELLGAFSDVEDKGLSLHIAGSPSSRELAHSVLESVRTDSRVSARLEYLTDADFVGAATSSELIVLPYLHMHNSGSVLAALSLGRPVLVPDNEVNRRLASEVGPGWVHVFTAPLTGAALETARAAVVNDPPSAPPDLSRRSWSGAGRDHRRAFVAARRR